MYQAKNHNLTATHHFVEMLELRQNRIVPDIDGIHTLMATQEPVYIEEQTDDKFKLFYSVDVEYDLIIVISCKNFSPYNINLITVHQQEAKRRPVKND
jgi:hypothetical protein